jgi:hypothetical protein
MRILYLLSAAAAAGTMAVPAAAQQPYPYPYPQPAPQAYPPGYGYPQPGYPQTGYGQPYGGNAVEQIINQLLGNRYNVNDRTAVSRCARAALSQAEAQYRPGYGYNGYNQQYRQPYGQQYSQMRVTSITDVDQRRNGLRVRGTIDSGAYVYGNRYNDPRYARAGDLSFRCNVDYRGAVTDVRISRNNAYRR